MDELAHQVTEIISARTDISEDRKKQLVTLIEDKRETLADRRKDLRFKLASLIVSILGFSVVAFALYVNWKQSKVVDKSLRANVQLSMTKVVLDLDRLLVDRPELNRYFHNGRGGEPDPTNREQVEATAIMVLDVLDVAQSQADAFKDQWNSPNAWNEWIIDEFAESPFLREVYQHRSNWYGTTLSTNYQKALKRVPIKP